MLGAKAASATADGKGEDLWKIMNRMSKPGKAVYPIKDEGLEVARSEVQSLPRTVRGAATMKERGRRCYKRLG